MKIKKLSFYKHKDTDELYRLIQHFEQHVELEHKSSRKSQYIFKDIFYRDYEKVLI